MANSDRGSALEKAEEVDKERGGAGLGVLAAPACLAAAVVAGAR